MYIFIFIYIKNKHINMTNIDVIFGRNLLKEVLKTVVKHTTVNQRKSVWTYHFGRDNYEVQSTGKDKVTPSYWQGSASNAYEARANFWMRWLDKNHKNSIAIL